MTRGEVEAICKDTIERHPIFVLVRTLGNRLIWGTGSPAGVKSAPIGTIYVRLDGGAATTLYVKESGTSTGGWVAK